ncbi:MAG: 2TM domain-containing protein [Bacteroidota bacterium]
MEEQDIHKKTQQLLDQLGYFVAHVVSYIVCNIGLTLYIFSNIQRRWGLLFIILFWSIALIYHGIKVYGVDVLSSRNKKLNQYLMWLLKMAGA